MALKAADVAAKDAAKAFENELYKEAEDLYTRAMEANSRNPAFYEGRSAARIQLHMYQDAMHDAEQAIELDHDFVMGYFRLGVALQCLRDYPRSIVSFSEGIKRDQKNPLLLNAIIEVALISPIRSSLEPVISQLRKMRLDANPFVITSVVGQELLSHDQIEEAVQVLENAVAIGTRSLKLKGSVFSALSSALWSLGDTDRAIHYMKQDLTVSRSLSDNAGECRAHGNLGAAYFSQQNYQLARDNHNRQLALAQTMQDHKGMASAFSSLGHIHTATAEHQSAAESHKQSAAISRNMKDTTGWCQQLRLVAASFLALGDLDSALQWQLECLRVTTDEFEIGSQEAAREEAKARVDLAALYHKLQKYTEEISCLQKSVEISRNINDDVSEAQTLSSLGYITRHTGDIVKAQASYERLLELALTRSDGSMEAKACANLGVIHHQTGDYEMALKLQARNLELSIDFRDVASQGRAHGNIGNAYSAMGMFGQAIQHHMKELEISAITGDWTAECSTHGNLAVAFQAMKNPEKAFYHYSCQASLASQIGDAMNESRAYMNLANFHSSRKEFQSAIEVYSKYLSIAETYGFEKPTGIARACYNTGFAYFSLGDYPNAITFYEKCLEISLNHQDIANSARTYCNLGLSWKACGDTVKAFECQNCFFSLSNHLQSTRGVFKALGNLADIYMVRKQPSEAVGMHQQQYDLAKQGNDTLLLAQASGSLGVALRLVGDFQKSIECHAEELQIYQTVKDARSEFRAHGRLGAVLTMLGEFSSAAKCYENQCYIAEQLDDVSLQSTAVGNMGITSINLQDYEKAIGFFERQLLVVQNAPESKLEKAKVLCNIGDCYEALENYDEAITLFEEALEYIIEVNHGPSLERVYRGLSSTYKLSNKPQEAFKFCRLRVETCREIRNYELLAEALGEMGFLFTTVADFESALSYLEAQMKFAETIPHLLGDAACGLGSVCQITRDYKKAVEYHQIDLQVAMETDNLPCQGRAHGNLGAVYESLHCYKMAIKHQEQHLLIANNLKDPLAKLTALKGMARNVLRSDTSHQRAALLLQQALLLARELNAKEDEGKIILDLALANWVCGNLNDAETGLLEAEKILTDGLWKSGVLDSTLNISVHPNSYINLFEEIQTCRSALSSLYVETSQHRMAIEAAEKLRQLSELVVRKRLKKNQEFPKNMTEKLEQYCVSNDSIILYYSVQAGAILIWIFTPEEGFCGFVRRPIFLGSKEPTESCENLLSQDFEDHRNLLTQLIFQLQDTLGLESPSTESEETPGGENEEQSARNGEENQLDKLPEPCIGKDHTFQLYYRLIRAQIAAQYSRNISALGVTRLSDTSEPNKSPIYALYDLLIGKIQEKIQKYGSKNSMKRLVLVVDGELLMVPFALLKGRPSEPYLSQQFSLQIVTSAHDLLVENRVQRSDVIGDVIRGVAIGNPDVNDVCSAPESQASEEEVNLVGTLLKIEPLAGKNATKETVLRKIKAAECLHLACNVSSKPPFHALLTDPTRISEGISGKMFCGASNTDSGIVRDSGSIAQEDSPDSDNREVALTPEQISRRSLAMGDLLNLDFFNTKVAVIGSAHLQNYDTQQDQNGPCLKAVKALSTAKSFFMSSAHALLLPLWPVPETACKLMIQSFYSRLMEGVSATQALSQSLDILRNSTQFEHPSYWAGFVLIGQDVTLDPRNLSLYYALKLLIQSSPERLHDVLRLIVHLTDKSLERMESTSDTTAPMFASQSSISKKVGNVNGWRELFSAVGFELRQSTSGIPDAVFFPGVEAKEYLEEIKSELVSYLQLPIPVLSSLNQLFSHPSTGYELKETLRTCLEEYRKIQDGHVECDNAAQLILIVQQNIWRSDGSSDLLTSVGFKVSQIREDNVTLHCLLDRHDDVETLFRLLSTYFGSHQKYVDADQEASEVAESVKCDKPDKTLVSRLSLTNTVICGLPSSTRRSIAVDFNASFKSPSSLDSSLHLELPDHMTSVMQQDPSHGLESVNYDVCHVTQPLEHFSAVDLDSSQHLELPDHMNTMNRDEIRTTESVGGNLHHVTQQPLKRDDHSAAPHSPKNFVLKPPSGSIIAPKPRFTPNLPRYMYSPDPLVFLFGANAIEKVPFETPSSHSIQRSKRFQFHSSGSANTTVDTLEVKLPRSPEKSPMFYRKSDDVSQEVLTKPSTNDTGLQKLSSPGTENTSESLFFDVGRELPRKITTDVSYSTEIVQKSQIAAHNGENKNHFIPIHSPSKILPHAFEYEGIVHPKPKRPGSDPSPRGSKSSDSRSTQGSYVPAPSVAKGMHTKTNPFDYDLVVDKLTRLSTNDRLVKEDRRVASSNRGTEARPGHSIQEYGNVLSCLQPELPQIISATDMVESSPQSGAREVEVKPYGSHFYSRSLDSAVVTQGQKPALFPHQHSLSQDGAPPPPYQHPEFVVSPRRASEDTIHSGASSHASRDSVGSQKGVRKKKEPKRRLKKANSNQSYSGSDGSQAPHQFETNNQVLTSRNDGLNLHQGPRFGCSSVQYRSVRPPQPTSSGQTLKGVNYNKNTRTNIRPSSGSDHTNAQPSDGSNCGNYQRGTEQWF